MLKKRLVGVVTVKDGWAVQSFGYRRHLPLGRPEWLVENLDRWGADEILVQCTDRSARRAGPDFALLERLGAMGLSTPLIYGGGIATAEQGVRAIQAGADRIALDAVLHEAPQVLDELGQRLGVQALVAAVPLRLVDGGVAWHDHRGRRDVPLDALAQALARGPASELLVIDCEHEGGPGRFDSRLLDAVAGLRMPTIAFGGIGDVALMRTLLPRPDVVALAIGNFLAYRELALQQFRQALDSDDLRPPLFASSRAP